MERKSLQFNDGVPYACVVIGEQSLLTQCCELLQKKSEFDIQYVISVNPVINAWCLERDITCLSSTEELLDKAGGNKFDVLFSITNLKILPSEIISLPTQFAINFHDGPLPSYGGLNAPAWALMNGEKNHGVTWHLMTQRVDEGGYLSQKKFPIAKDDTAFTLNAKCYEAGIETFSDLLHKLVAGKTNSVVQALDTNTIYRSFDKPKSAAVIDWSQPTDNIIRLVHGLDFGQYKNPLLKPRLHLGSQHLLVGEARNENSSVTQSPGTVLSMSASDLNIATLDGSVVLSRISDINGEALDVSSVVERTGIFIGDVLPILSPVEKDKVTETVDSISRYESTMIELCSLAEPLPIPYTSKPGKSEENADSKKCWEIVFVDRYFNASDRYSILGQLLSLLARISNASCFSVAVDRGASTYDDDYTDELINVIRSPVLPFSINYSPSESFTQWVENLTQQWETLNEQNGYLTDLWVREPNLKDVVKPENYPIKIHWMCESPEAQSRESNDVALDASKTRLNVYIPRTGEGVYFKYDSNSISKNDVQRLADQFRLLNESISKSGNGKLSDYAVIPEYELEQINTFHGNNVSFDTDIGIHTLFERQAEQTPDALAIVFKSAEITYQELNTQANQLAHHLLDAGLQPGNWAGVLLERSVEMLVSMLAVLKAGCAYVPMDPHYPEGRLLHMAQDAEIEVVLSHSKHEGIFSQIRGRSICVDRIKESRLNSPKTNPCLTFNANDVAYVIYTSGSTGKPKGVMVEHQNVLNFFQGMDERIGTDAGRWLAVTSISFDISVLELFWTLCRGYKVVLYPGVGQETNQTHQANVTSDQQLDFSLFYWNVADENTEYQGNKYQLLLDSAKYADENGFLAVWTPERHFSAFGGLFPNPAVTSAALATITKNIQIRAGSCVVPLHSPIRIAEDWSVIDNLSNGRVGIAMASGWAAPDFAIMPDNFADAKKIMFESADVVQRLWRGEHVEFPGADGKPSKIRTLPTPIQKSLPMWITTAGNLDSFRQAGCMGANILTHLLGQTIDEVTEKVLVYRKAWADAGNRGTGKVTVMLHTFVGPDEQSVESFVRAPLKQYLKSAMFLVKNAAWQFPTFVKMSEEQGKTLDEFFESISEEDMDALLEFSFQRYFKTSGLFGTPSSCAEMIEKVKQADIDEIACLIDFGIDTNVVVDHLPYLKQLKNVSNSRPESVEIDDKDTFDYSLPALIKQHDITHLQCTPSMATLLVADSKSQQALKQLKHLMVGGEAFPPDLAQKLTSLVAGRITNMYGPTETTIWSCTDDIDDSAGATSTVSIGQALPNQQVYILDDQLEQLPLGAVGELYIGGLGVVRGYHARDALNQKAFIPDKFNRIPCSRMYRTGDLAKFTTDGRLECLGRIDQQVKIRGYRVELGEIESALRLHESVNEVAVLLMTTPTGTQRLVAYVTLIGGGELNPPTLKTYLSNRLPDFMVPSDYIQLQSLPLTPNGKIDRAGLPNVVRTPVSISSGNKNSTEHMIAKIWAQALNVDDVGVNDNFFDIGGHSLLIVQVLKELSSRTEKSLKLTDLFKYTTIKSLASYISADTDKTELSRGQARVAARKASKRRTRTAR